MREPSADSEEGVSGCMSVGIFVFLTPALLLGAPMWFLLSGLAVVIVCASVFPYLVGPRDGQRSDSSQSHQGRRHRGDPRNGTPTTDRRTTMVIVAMVLGVVALGVGAALSYLVPEQVTARLGAPKRVSQATSLVDAVTLDLEKLGLTLLGARALDANDPHDLSGDYDDGAVATYGFEGERCIMVVALRYPDEDLFLEDLGLGAPFKPTELESRVFELYCPSGDCNHVVAWRGGSFVVSIATNDAPVIAIDVLNVMASSD